MINESDYRFYKMLIILPSRRTRFAFLLFKIATRKKKLIVIFSARHFEVFFVGSSKVAADDECTVWRVDDDEVLSFTHTHREHRMGSSTNLIAFRGENANSMEIVTLSTEFGT